jgi:hypothetical protein
MPLTGLRPRRRSPWPSPSFALAVAVTLVAGTSAALPTKDECINANEAAQSLRTAGKLRAAQEKLTLCTAKTCPGPVRDDCTERLNEVLKAQPTVVFDLRTPAGADVVGARVTMDGAPLAARLDGSAVAVDPGKHTFGFTADGFAPVEESLLMKEGDKARVERVVLRTGPGPDGVEGGGSGATAEGASAGGRAASGPSTLRTLTFATLGVGAVGVAVGAIFGGLALGDHASLHSHCNGNACPASEQSDIDALHTHAVLANVGFGVGVASLAASTVLYLVAPRGGSGSSATAMGTATSLTIGSTGVRIGPGGPGLVGTFP